MKGQRTIIFTILFSLISFAALPQKLIRGFVIDSASFIPLSYVNIKVRNSNRGTSTDTKGGFTINTAKTDTLEFTLIGYNSEVFTAAELEETVIIRMGVVVRQLREIVIIGHKEKAVPALHMTPRSTVPNTPSTAGFNLGYFSKYEREKRKLAEVKAAHELVRNYISVVCDPEIRQKICSEFTLTDDEYFQLLAKFNIQNLNRTYDLTTAEWITAIRKFYSDNVYKR